MNMKDTMFNRVMIVDDTRIDRYIASHVLKKNQFAKEILEFDMATKAIDYLEQNQDSPELLPEVILLDIRMPEMDGFQFLERLAMLPQSLKQSCCIVMLSSSLDPHDHNRAENNPVVKKFLNKPLVKENFEEIIELYYTSNLNTLKGTAPVKE
jgi:CheY-like chemotaxis protein